MIQSLDIRYLGAAVSTLEFTHMLYPEVFRVCGARYKTRQGLSYHLSHTHKGGRANSGGGRSRGGGNSNNNTPSAHPRADPASYQPQAFQSDALAGLAEFQDNYLGYLSAGQDASPTGMPPPPCLRPCLCLLPLAPSLNACYV
ncbi:hypothetical protein E2C01_008440 [Portunus trituberculatus]|uniref:Uncharacterized protein n=1 Tax=Portunus trituberculatus TaxID=210409 RepID=A0A5B7D356_PORTR|nr:hypothetical protein [Portunus trituberculatus]